jgi:hypothetical protein
MSYSVGGTIQATDYNTIVGASGTTSGSLNYVYSTGSGAIGYGQTAVSTLTAGTLVTAAQWSSMLTPLNKCLAHQGQTQLAYTYTTGQTIQYLANVTSAVSQVNSTYASYYAQGSTTTGTTYSPNPTAAVNTSYGESTVFTRTVTFASADAARYFFNAGGQINFVTISVANNDGSGRSADIASIGSVNFNLTNTAGNGTGGNGTNGYGYRSLPTGPVVVLQNTQSGTYSGDFVKLYVSTNGINSGGNGDYGSAITFWYNLYSSGHGSWNTTMNVTINHRVDIIYPESTYLASSWGTPTVG